MLDDTTLVTLWVDFMKERPMNRYFRTDIPLVVSDEAEGHLVQHTSDFWPRRQSESQQATERHTLLLNRQDVDRLRGKRSFSYHVMALMVRKEYGDISRAMDDMIAVGAEWEHKPFIQEVDGEPKQVVPFSKKAQVFSGGFQSTPAELVDAKDDEPQKVAFEWRTNLY